jgi:uncharacterized membrane protein HdeD (DUF308 family)
MQNPKRSPWLHALLVGVAVLGTFLLIVGVLYVVAALVLPYFATPS